MAEYDLLHKEGHARVAMVQAEEASTEEPTQEETSRVEPQDMGQHSPFEWSVSLPLCTYTHAFLAVHEFKDALTRDSEWITFRQPLFWFLLIGSVIPGVTLFLVSIAAQIVITYFVLQELEQVDVCHVSTSVWIQWSGVALFIGAMLKEAVETISIAYWILCSNHVAKDIEDDLPEDLTALDKIAGIVLLVIPKLAIGLWLTWVGSRFVLLSITNTDLVLNCLAMAFVIEIDELVYEIASNQHSKKNAEHLKPAGAYNENAFWIDMVAATPLKLLVWGGAALYFKMTVPQC